jgi:hypothetical protein
MKPNKTIKSKSQNATTASSTKPPQSAPAKSAATAPAAKSSKANTPVKTATAVRKTTPAKAAPTKTITIQRREITTEAIASFAYTLWEQSGRPNGRDKDFWFQAEQKLKQEAKSLTA